MNNPELGIVLTSSVQTLHMAVDRLYSQSVDISDDNIDIRALYCGFALDKFLKSCYFPDNLNNALEEARTYLDTFSVAWDVGDDSEAKLAANKVLDEAAQLLRKK